MASVLCLPPSKSLSHSRGPVPLSILPTPTLPPPHQPHQRPCQTHQPRPTHPSNPPCQPRPNDPTPNSDATSAAADKVDDVREGLRGNVGRDDSKEGPSDV